MTQHPVANWEKRRYASRIDAFFAKYLESLGSFPELAPDDEEELRNEFLQGRTEARDMLIQHNLWRVPVIVRRFLSRGLSFQDFVQDGNLAVIEAVDRFLSEKGYFLLQPILHHLVKQRIASEIGKYYGTSHPYIPPEEWVRAKKVREAIEYLTALHHRPPNALEIVLHAKLPLNVVGPALRLFRTTIYAHEFLDEVAPTKPSGAISLEMIDDAQKRLTIFNELRNRVNEELRGFPERTQRVVTWRLGLNGVGKLSLREVASRCQLSIYDIGRIESEAVQQISDTLATSVDRLWRLSNNIETLETFLRSVTT